MRRTNRYAATTKVTRNPAPSGTDGLSTKPSPFGLKRHQGHHVFKGDVLRKIASHREDVSRIASPGLQAGPGFGQNLFGLSGQEGPCRGNIAGYADSSSQNLFSGLKGNFAFQTEAMRADFQNIIEDFGGVAANMHHSVFLFCLDPLDKVF